MRLFLAFDSGFGAGKMPLIIANIKVTRVMKEVIIYGIAALSSLTLLAYTVHMFIGGLVDERTESLAMMGVTGAGAIGIGLLAWKAVKIRRGL